MPPKQRGRKPKDEYFKTKTPDTVKIDRVVTICLPITLEDCMENLNINRQYEIMSVLPGDPAPYQEEGHLFYSVLDNEDKKPIIVDGNKLPIYDNIVKIDPDSTTKIEIYETRILPNEISKNNDKNISFKTDIACFWCCHTFENSPVFMPISLVRDVYKVSGCFCSFECCHSYMMDNSKHQKNKHLLNYMFRDITGIRGKPIGDKGFTSIIGIGKAPPRESLLMFGGSQSIEEFRENNSSYKNIHYPMVHVSNQMEKKSIIKKHKSTKEVKPILPLSNNTKTRNSPSNSLSKLIGLKIK